MILIYNILETMGFRCFQQPISSQVNPVHPVPAYIMNAEGAMTRSQTPRNRYLWWCPIVSQLVLQHLIIPITRTYARYIMIYHDIYIYIQLMGL